jgi:hypothetical protein
MSRNDPYQVHAIELGKAGWYARRMVGRYKKAGATGVVLSGIIRTQARSLSSRKASVGIFERGNQLALVTPYSKWPKWSRLPAGEHRLSFSAVRSRSGSRFERDITLADGDIFLVVCEPIQRWSLFGRSPEIDTWYIGIV